VPISLAHCIFSKGIQVRKPRPVLKFYELEKFLQSSQRSADPTTPSGTNAVNAIEVVEPGNNAPIDDQEGNIDHDGAAPNVDTFDELDSHVSSLEEDDFNYSSVSKTEFEITESDGVFITADVPILRELLSDIAPNELERGAHTQTEAKNPKKKVRTIYRIDEEISF
jgi:hypothetical protein